MPGTLVRDSLAPKLLDAADIDDSADDGAAVEINKPGEVAFHLHTAAVTGTNPTLDVEVTASDDSTFASGVVSLGRFAQVTAAVDSDSPRKLVARCYKRYVKALVTVGGTTPVFNDVTVVARTVHDRRNTDDTA